MKLHGMIVAGAVALASAAMSDEPDWARLMAEAEWDWRPGDLIFRSGLNDADDVLKHASDAPWATVGILRASSGGPRVVYVDETEGVTEVMLYRFVEELTPEDYAVYRIESLSSTLEDGQQLQGPLARYALNVAFGAPFDVQFQLGNDAYYSAELIYEAAMSAGVKLAEPVTLASLAAADTELGVRILTAAHASQDCASAQCGSLVAAQKIVTVNALLRSDALTQVFPE